MQVAVNKADGSIISVFMGAGKQHDFKLYKESRIAFLEGTKLTTDSGFQGVQKIHKNTSLPIKRKKGQKLSKEDKAFNKKLSQERVLNENVLSMLKRFKIIACRYRNRRKRFGLRFNLLAGIYNFELKNGF